MAWTTEDESPVLDALVERQPLLDVLGERHPQLDVLVERHMSELRSYVQLRTGPVLRSKEPISDIVQSTLREVVADRAEFVYTSEAAFRCWIYRVATNKIISKSRYHAAERREAAREEPLASAMWNVPQRDASSPGGSPSRLAVHAEDLERLRIALDGLDDQDRQIVSMRRIFDIPTSQIASELGLAESTVRWRLARVMTELAARMS
jgi:RNA polymerase sigma factor (sigma-70 family)